MFILKIKFSYKQKLKQIQYIHNVITFDITFLQSIQKKNCIQKKSEKNDPFTLNQIDLHLNYIRIVIFFSIFKTIEKNIFEVKLTQYKKQKKTEKKVTLQRYRNVCVLV